MDSLFGIPIGTLTTYLTVILAIALALTAVIALRNPVVLKMATRNIPRRRAQSALIVLGLMLATLLFSASFATGDTLAHSIRVQALAEVGQVDEVVFSDELEASGRPRFIPEDTASAVRDALADAPVDGVTPSISLNVPAIAVVSQRSEPRLGVQGFDPAQMAGFDRYLDEDGNELDLGSLDPGEAYFSAEAAQELGANAGDQIALFFEETPVTISVAGVFEKGGNARDSAAAIMLLGDLQEILGEQGRINLIGISNDGDLIAGGNAHRCRPRRPGRLPRRTRARRGQGQTGHPRDRRRAGQLFREHLPAVRQLLDHGGHPPHLPYLRDARRRAEA